MLILANSSHAYCSLNKHFFIFKTIKMNYTNHHQSVYSVCNTE